MGYFDFNILRSLKVAGKVSAAGVPVVVALSCIQGADVVETVSDPAPTSAKSTTIVIPDEFNNRHSHAYITPQILTEKYVQARDDLASESELEQAIESEFGFELRIRNDISPVHLQKFQEYLRTIYEINPKLVNAVRGLEIFLLPNHVRGGYGGLRSDKGYIELFETSGIGTIVHEFSHEYADDIAKGMEREWRNIVERHGFSYETDLADPVLGNLSMRWRNGTRVPRDVFQRPYAANLVGDLPGEHISTIHEALYTGDAFIAVNGSERDCYLDLFALARSMELFSEREYQHAIDSLVFLPDVRDDESLWSVYTVEEGDTLTEIGVKRSIPWQWIAEDNSEKYPYLMEHPERLQIGAALNIIDHYIINHKTPSIMETTTE